MDNFFQHKARKRFGQNFLVDDNIIERIVRAIGPRETDRLIEIGPGQAAQAAPDHGNLQAVGQAGVHKVRLGEGDHLGLVLQAPEIGGENDPVVIHLKPEAGLVLFFTQTLVCIALPAEGEELFPLHHTC